MKLLKSCDEIIVKGGVTRHSRYNLNKQKRLNIKLKIKEEIGTYAARM